ncbi:MAG: restriction endonuclease subunit S [Ignavibacteriaceae bacterium]|nr:restriction endonuclease subunit S [Ignavibacteriaceae bacterium]
MPALKDIVRIQTGIYLKPNQFGNTVYIQLKDFNERGQLITHLIPEISITDRLSHHLLNAGDILFAAKGDKNLAAIYRDEYPSAVASSSFFVLKPTKEILPDFLVWFLNHPDSQKKLKSEAKGSSIASISMKALGNLEVKIPDLHIQQLILKVDELRKKEKCIQNELMSLKDQITDTRIIEKI